MFVLFASQFELTERKKARSEYEKMLFRQEMEAEELRISSESALKELQQLQVSCAFRYLTRDSVEFGQPSKILRVTCANVSYFIQGTLRLVQKLRATFSTNQKATPNQS